HRACRRPRRLLRILLQRSRPRCRPLPARARRRLRRPLQPPAPRPALAAASARANAARGQSDRAGIHPHAADAVLRRLGQVLPGASAGHERLPQLARCGPGRERAGGADAVQAADGARQHAS
ncbi:hypothetical protein LTR16_010479, partial [Cryomyces antarcticus]